jgi:hypothetical protein
MRTALDIDVDFFVTPIKHWGESDERLPEQEFFSDSVTTVLSFLSEKCGVSSKAQIPGACFEHHDELFDYAINHFKEPVHLIHVDAHADIGGGLSSCWYYVCTEYLHLSPEMRQKPRRGNKFLNEGNFVVFLAACGMLSRVTFVSHPEWHDDYNAIHMKDFDPLSEALQLKRYSANVVAAAGIAPLGNSPHDVEPEVPFRRIPGAKFSLVAPPDFMFVTRSPGYTPRSADALYAEIARLIIAQ